MANTGFISMAPAIAAVAAQITTVDGIVDDILVDTDNTIPAALTVIDDEMAVVDGIVDDILVDTDATIPAVLTVIDNEMAVVDGIVDNILVDTDATIPAAIAAIRNRGEFEIASYKAAPGHINYLDVVNQSGSSGKLIMVFAGMVGSNGRIWITLVSSVSNGLQIQAAQTKYFEIVLLADTFEIQTTDTMTWLMLEYRNDFRVELKQDNGANQMECYVFFQDDS